MRALQVADCRRTVKARLADARAERPLHKEKLRQSRVCRDGQLG